MLQWFVRPGDRVSQFDKLCEVQSDKVRGALIRKRGRMTCIRTCKGDIVKLSTGEGQSLDRFRRARAGYGMERKHKARVGQSVLFRTPAIRFARGVSRMLRSEQRGLP